MLKVKYKYNIGNYKMVIIMLYSCDGMTEI